MPTTMLEALKAELAYMHQQKNPKPGRIEQIEAEIAKLEPPAEHDEAHDEPPAEHDEAHDESPVESQVERAVDEAPENTAGRASRAAKKKG